MNEPRGMTREQANELRKQGVVVHGCWMCIFMDNKANQWREEDLKFYGHRIFCPKHYAEQIGM